MKCDHRASSTGNIAIEFARIKKPHRDDGIIKAERNGLHWWMHWLTDGRLFVFDVPSFAQFLRQTGSKYPNFQVEDTQGYIVPIEAFESQYFVQEYFIPYKQTLSKFPLPKEYFDNAR